MAKSNIPKTQTFKFVKAIDFKTIRIDGVFGGLNVKRNININFFVDTLDLPEAVIHPVDGHGRIGAQLPTESVPAISIREVPFAINVDIETAKLIVIWLNEKIKEAEVKNAALIEIQKKAQEDKI